MGCRAFALRGCLWRRGCSGRRMAQPPARLGVLTSFGAAPRSPPVPSGPSGALHTSGAWSLMLLGASSRSPAGPRRRPPAPRQVPPAPFTPVVPGVLMCGSVRRLEARPGPATASSISHAIPSDVFHGLKCDRWNSADSALVWGRAKLELHAKLRCGVSLLWSSLLLRGIALLG